MFEYETSFINAFCKTGDVMDLTKVSFDTDWVRIGWCTYEGQHFVDSVKLEEFQEWMDRVKNANGV